MCIYIYILSVHYPHITHRPIDYPYILTLCPVGDQLCFITNVLPIDYPFILTICPCIDLNHLLQPSYRYPFYINHTYLNQISIYIYIYITQILSIDYPYINHILYLDLYIQYPFIIIHILSTNQAVGILGCWHYPCINHRLSIYYPYNI